MPKTKRKPTKKPTKPTLKMPGGKRASELTQTISMPQGFVNVPTIDPVRRMSVTTEEGIRMEKKANKGKLKFYKTKAEALKAAKKRSEAGGRYRKR